MQKSNLFKGSLLVTGTTIGGGMLALPVMTSLGGFFPSLLIYFLCWLFMAATGLLFLEVCLWLKKDSNIVTMAEKTLGNSGKVFAWIVYLFLFYCLTLAYIVGCGNLLAELFQGYLPEGLACLLFTALFAPLVYVGTTLVGRLNIVLMMGLTISYFAFVFLGYSHIKVDLLLESNWLLSIKALPVAFTAFAYQGMIPTLYNYMHHDARNTRKAILIGSFIPLIAYIIWAWLILGIVPINAPGGLADALKAGETAVQPLKNFINNPSVYIVGRFFAFFALVTSFLGVTLGLLDFLADGLKIEKNPKGRILLCLAIFLPPLGIALSHPHLFLTALGYAGGIGCALLLGLLPIAMVWRGRYMHLYDRRHQQLPGGKVILLVMAAFVLFELAFEVTQILGI